jgi:hypothetical protein
MRRVALTIALLAAASALAEEPPAAGRGRLTLAGEASGAFAPRDPAFFNYTDYEYTALRLGRLGLAADLRLGERVSILGEARSDNLEAPRIHALYARVTPLPGRGFDLQAGRIPPVFGAFPRRSYASDNFLIGYPLAYQYLTSLRADALPATENDLLRMRGRGWRSSFPVGSPYAGPGLPLVNALRWDTGVQARVGSDRAEAMVALTTGSLSSPRVEDDNDGRQVCARAALRPVVGLVLGASAARGAYAADEATEGTGLDASDLLQRAYGVDAEYSRDYWLVRAEAVWSRWDVPPLAEPRVAGPVRARAVSVEGRYKILPGLYAAARVDHLGFSRLGGGATWEAPVLRFEGGAGYNIRRRVLLKAVYQHNRREGDSVRSLDLVAGQLLAWF